MKKIIINLFLIISLSFILFGCGDKELKDFKYIKKNNEITITGVKNYEKEELIIPEGVTSIDDVAFLKCEGKLLALTIPKSLKSIYNKAFNGAGRPAVYYNGTLSDYLNIEIKYTASYYGPEYRGNALWCWQLYTYNENGKFEKNGKKYDFINKMFTKFEFPDGLEKIGNMQLKGFDFRELTDTLVIPNSVKHIGDYAFFKSRFNQSNLMIPSSVTSIGKCAFRATFIESVTIPKSVTSIGEYAFDRNGDGVDIYVKTVYYEGTEEEWNKIDIAEHNEWLDYIVVFLGNND